MALATTEEGTSEEKEMTNFPKRVYELTRAHIFISGWVQGVGFRYWVRSEALKLGLTGWVRNLPNGQVEAIFEGPKEKVEEMIEKCRKGPVWTGDNEVEMEWKKASKEFSEFEIRK